jgi:hypothetical protein
MKPSIKIFLLLCTTAALVPFLPAKPSYQDSSANFPGWPTQFEGKPLQQLELSEREERFARDFPGRAARFTDGEREYIIRWTVQPSRTIQSAWNCFHGLDYTLHFGPMWRDQQEYPWRTFEAIISSETLQVSERIYDESGKSWTEIPAWYWAALLGETKAPWWIVTIIEK